MEIAKTKRKRQKDSVLGVKSATGRRAPLSMYTNPPMEELTLTQFENYALDRLAVLRYIETLQSKGVRMPDLGEKVLHMCKERQLNDQYIDNTSHFILRLAYCRTVELRRWLTTQESWLFRIRFENEPRERIRTFFKQNNLQYKPLSSIPASLFAMLETTHRGMSSATDPVENVYYKVPFEEALDLVGKRHVFIQGGDAYVPSRLLVRILHAKFRAHLSMELAVTYRASQNMRQDKRIQPIVRSLAKRHVGPKYKAAEVSGQVTPDQLPVLAPRSFPMCMEHAYDRLIAESHLRHGGRMMLGLFLKGIGLSMQDALDFWRKAFSKRTPADKFNKEYAYNIRHNYGKEGKRTSYTPYNCSKIINFTPGPGDHHCCPFRHFDASRLRAKMQRKGVPQASIHEVIELVKGHHYQVACQRYFQATHPNSQAFGVGNHPNAYFDQSVKYYEEKKTGGSSNSSSPVKTEQPTSSSSSSSSSSASSTPPAEKTGGPTATPMQVDSKPSSTPLKSPVTAPSTTTNKTVKTQ